MSLDLDKIKEAADRAKCIAESARHARGDAARVEVDVDEMDKIAAALGDAVREFERLNRALRRERGATVQPYGGGYVGVVRGVGGVTSIYADEAGPLPELDAYIKREGAPFELARMVR